MKHFAHIILILFLVAQGWAAGAVTYVCQMSGEVMSTCCCPDAGNADCAVLEAVDNCCDVHVTPPAEAPAALRTNTHGPEQNTHPVWSLQAALFAVDMPQMPQGFAAAQTRHLGGSPPPLILITQSIRC